MGLGPKLKPAAAAAVAGALHTTRECLPRAMTVEQRLAGLPFKAAGGFGAIHLELKDGEARAVKSIRLWRLSDEAEERLEALSKKARRTARLKLIQQELAKVEREAECMLDLAPHPNLIGLLVGPGGDDYELLKHDLTAILRLEYVDGPQLSKLIRDLPLLGRTLRQLILDLVAGLHHMHRGGWVHRDIKASNLMVTAAGRLKIVDYGCARRSVPSKRTDLVGTTEYLSPQAKRTKQAQNPKPVYDVLAADLYAAGLVALQMRLGKSLVEELRPPGHDDDTIVDYGGLAQLHLQWQSIQSNAWQLDALILRLLADEEEERGTAEQFYNTCEALCRGFSNTKP